MYNPRGKMMRILLFVAALVISKPALAGSTSLLVLGFRDHQYVSVVLRQQADYVAMSLSISSDQRDPIQRFAEIRDTKAIIQKKAEKDADIIIHTGPVTLSAQPTSKLSYLSSSSGASSEAQLEILVPLKDKNRDVFKCASMIRKFINDITMPGKATVQLGTIQLAVDNPEQFRDLLLQKISEDVAKAKEKLKAEGKVQLSGLESPVLVRQTDDKNVELFINYQFSVEMK
jgi:hypothetical protein